MTPRTFRSDIYELVAGRQLEILRALGIQWNPSRSRQHIQCPFPDHADQHPSWRWDDGKGRYFCTCGSGDVLGATMKMRGLQWREAADYVREALGETAHPARRSPDGYDPDRYLRVLLRSGSGQATLADVYLQSRGIALAPWPDALRFNASTYCKATNSHLPAVIALMSTAPDAEPTSVLRIYLTSDGKAKAAISEPKLSLGKPLAGKAVWLGEPGERIIITEGVEDAAACLIACETFAAAGIGANTANIVLPASIREAIIFADRDDDGQGLRIAGRLAERLHAHGRQVMIAMAPAPYKDANELLIKQGPGGVERAIEAAEP
jgi:DNA primase